MGRASVEYQIAIGHCTSPHMNQACEGTVKITGETKDVGIRRTEEGHCLADDNRSQSHLSMSRMLRPSPYTRHFFDDVED